MTNLVAEVAEEGPIGLVQFESPLLAFRIVGFGEIDRDDTAVVSGENVSPSRSRYVSKKLIGQPVNGVIDLVLHRKAEPQETVYQTAFGHLHAVPRLFVPGLA